MIALGTQASNFSLPNVISEENLNLQEFHIHRAFVVMFLCNHCPFVKHVQYRLVEITNTYILKAVTFIAINSNDIKNYPDDSLANMKKVAKTLNIF